MIDLIEEWYRIVSLSPNAERISHHKALVEKLIPELANIDTQKLLLEATSFALGKSKPELELEEFISAADNAIDDGITLNLDGGAKELAIVIAATLGEIQKTPSINERVRALSALSVISGAGVVGRKARRPRHYLKMISELLEISSSTMKQIAEKSRLHPAFNSSRKPFPPPAKMGETIADHGQLGELLTMLSSRIMGLEKALSISLEENEVSWWMFAKRSKIANELFAEMDIFSAFYLSGIELSELYAFPPPLNAKYILEEVHRTKDGGAPMTASIEGYFKDVRANLINGQAGLDPAENVTPDLYPRVFPLSWIMRQEVVGEGEKPWTSVFHQLTGVPKSQVFSIAEMATQVLFEAVCIRECRI